MDKQASDMGEMEQGQHSKSFNRRALLKAGWIIPAIVVTPLMNTASAQSTVDCDNLLQKRDFHRKNGDRAAYNNIQAKLDANGCPC